HQAMEDAFMFNADAAPAFVYNEDESYIPLFMREGDMDDTLDGKVPSGALYGTAMHRFLECFDFTNPDIVGSFDEQLKYMRQIKCLSEDEFSRISINKLKTFLKDESAIRMAAAAASGKLYKEKPFVYGSDAKSLFDDDKSGDEMILVQGIIDVFWEEDDGIVLLDYKTDRVDSDEQLMVRYEKQLELYKNAIEASYGVKVKEVLIYSFALERSINLCTTSLQ
ncbi:MAG: PD-(D/E)XK nuclease family protein, partial [Pseudobutyrivibrio sp.]|nr:PD-(D/E)XK nuclease family protein [Pseudobutyrivibrio sp.]